MKKLNLMTPGVLDSFAAWPETRQRLSEAQETMIFNQGVAWLANPTNP